MNQQEQVLHPLAEAGELEQYWSPKILGQVNDQFIKVAKLKGDLAWHAHDNEDELFIVLSGDMTMEYEQHQVVLTAGDFHVVPKGTLHNPVCDEECLVALIETVTTQHTGSTITEKTRSIEEQMFHSQLSAEK